MAKRRSRSNPRIADIVRAHVDDLVSALSAEIRRNVADEVQAYFAGAGGSAPLLRGRGRRKKRIIACIAPGCKNMSKGPRFHYLCDEHRGAKKSDYEAWRKAKKDKAERAAA